MTRPPRNSLVLANCDLDFAFKECYALFKQEPFTSGNPQFAIDLHNRVRRLGNRIGRLLLSQLLRRGDEGLKLVDECYSLVESAVYLLP